MSESRSFPPISDRPSTKKSVYRNSLLAATLGGASMLMEPLVASAQSNHHRSRQGEIARHHSHEHHGRQTNLRREARRSRWTAEDEEHFQFFSELIPYDHLQMGRVAQIPALQLDEDVRLLRRRILHLIQAGQGQRENPGLLTFDTTNHDNEDGTVRTDDLLDGSLADQDAASLTHFLESQRYRVMIGHYVHGYYEIARYVGNQDTDLSDQLAMLESNNPSDRTDFESAGEEMGQMSFRTRDVDQRDGHLDRIDDVGEGVGATPAAALSHALWSMMFRPTNQGTGRHASDGRRILRIQFEDTDTSFTDIHITSGFVQESDGRWHVRLAGTELRPPRPREQE